MLLPVRIARAVAAGDVDLAYRRWATLRVKVGSRFVTVAGVLEVTSVDAVDVADISPHDARRAGFPTPEKAIAALRDNDHQVYRVGLRWYGEDPRIALREDADLTDADIADLTRGSIDSTRGRRTDRGRSRPSRSSNVDLPPVPPTSQPSSVGRGTISNSTYAS